MNRRQYALAAVSVVVAALGGCGLPGAGGGRPADAAGGRPTPTGPPASASSALGTAGTGTDLPDPCTLLSRAEVTDQTGRPISEMDRDGAQPGDSTRYCQWQQDGGQLALFLARTTKEEFDAGLTDARPVEAVAGHDAFSLAGHLYVLAGAVQVDVYSRGGPDEANLAQERRIVELVLPRIE